MQRPAICSKKFAALLACLSLCAPALADQPLHCLWELHGKHNTVYLLGSIHVLRSSDYPLDKTIQDAYAKSNSLVMEINLAAADLAQVQAQMLASALLPDGDTLAQAMGPERYVRASTLAGGLGIDLNLFDRFAPWFVAEAISQLQLAALNFDPQLGVELYLLGRAQQDGKSVAGLEAVQDQISLFTSMSRDAQAEYLLSSLAQARQLPQEVNDMVRAWQRGDTAWFTGEMDREFGRDPGLYKTLLTARNRKWLPKIEALLNEDRNYLVIVGTGHLVGRNSVVELLQSDGIAVTQR